MPRSRPPLRRSWLRHQQRNDRYRDYTKLGKKAIRGVRPRVFDGNAFMRAMRRNWNAYNAEDKAVLSAQMDAAYDAEEAMRSADRRYRELASADADFTALSKSLRALLDTSREYINAVITACDTEDNLTHTAPDRYRLRHARERRRGYENSLRALRVNNPDAAEDERNANLRDTSGEPGWHGYQQLAPGGQGVVGVWTDDHDSIGDTVAVKDTVLSPAQWYVCTQGKVLVPEEIAADETVLLYRYDAEQWIGDIDDPAVKIPLEVDIAQAMNCDKIVRVRSWDLIESRLTSRIYMEHCRYGDLMASLVSHILNEREYPEPFIWHLFECLAEAGDAMMPGFVASAPPGSGPQEVVHRDIKPANVFLGLPSPTNFAAYPTAKLGDFGIAIRTSPTDLMNPDSYVGNGTDAYMAPEHSTLTDHSLSSATNVWGTGITVMALMEKDGQIGNIDFEEDPYTVPEFDHPGGQQTYTAELEDLVLQCLQPIPADRITTADLLDAIRHYTRHVNSDSDDDADSGGDERGNDLAFGMRMTTRQTARPDLLLFAPAIPANVALAQQDLGNDDTGDAGVEKGQEDDQEEIEAEHSGSEDDPGSPSASDRDARDDEEAGDYQYPPRADFPSADA